MVKATQAAAEAAGLTNVRAVQRDFIADGTGLPPGTMDYAMLFNILHAERPETMLSETFHVLRPGGRVGIIHWNFDPTTPRGPAMDIRPRPQQCQRWAHAAGFLLLEPGLIDLKPYHWGMAFSRPRGRNADEPTGFGSPSAYIPRPRRSQRE
jgi:predicted methyltransferase